MNQANLIVARIERARQDRGISVAELARRINVDRKRLWYVLNGQRSMHVDEFVRLCAVMDMSLAVSRQGLADKIGVMISTVSAF